MKARAPGKAVLSGAYAVLHGAPAIVTAVDRYVVADSARSAEFQAPEVLAALEPGQTPPWFDASALRDGDRKLGLGSSAAILVASLAALELERGGAADGLGERVLQRALAAHRAAQGGGSGVDVAASALGGTLACVRAGDALRCRALELPPALHLELWASPADASTRALLERVGALAESDPTRHAQLVGAQTTASVAAVERLDRGDAPGLVAALAAQLSALDALGRAAGAPIVTPELRSLAARGRSADWTVLPAGAGGGDVSWYAGLHPPSTDWSTFAIDLGLRRLDLAFGAAGVRPLGPDEEP